MLQWTAAGAGHRFVGIVHHTDADESGHMIEILPLGS